MSRITIWWLFVCVISATTVFAEEKCSTLMDVGFLLDSSGSISRYYNHEKKFMIALTESLGISKSGSHVGVITFSNIAVHSIKMKDHFDMTSFIQAVGKIPLMRSITRIDLALKMAKRELFKVSNGARANTRKLLILLTDGEQSKVKGVVDPTVVANELRKMGVTVMAVGMGRGVKKSELNKITNGHAYTASTFRQLVSAQFIKKLTGETCKVSKEPPPAVDGHWGDWGAYTTCDKKCGGGTKKRVRSCNKPPPTNGGKPCEGSATEVAKCNAQPCPVDGRWDSWGAYTNCTKPCGVGTKTRKRSCIAPQFGGKPCVGNDVETTKCNAQACPVDGRWDSWGAYTNCTKPCGVGTKTRKRSCIAPQFGGKPCVGNDVETTKCNAQACPVDGRWDSWGAYTNCTKPCGGGSKTRKRSCIAPWFGGKPCVGKDVETTKCNAQACPVPKCTIKMDVGFLLDSSGSITSYYGDEKKFLIALADSLAISKEGSHAGVITFSRKAEHSIRMKDHFNIKSFSEAVNKIPIMRSITRIDLALKMAKDELFQVSNGARLNTKKLLVLLTDGVQSKVRGVVDPTLVADELRKSGVTVMAVGMGPGVKKAELDKITKGHAFTAATFKELVSDTFIRKLTGETCKAAASTKRDEEETFDLENEYEDIETASEAEEDEGKVEEEENVKYEEPVQDEKENEEGMAEAEEVIEPEP